MTKKLIAAAAALVMCFALVSCGDSDSSGGTNGAAALPWGQSSEAESSADDESEAVGSKTEESKAEESKAEESKAEESKAETLPEESKADEPAESIAEPEESKPEQTASEPDPTPADGGFIVKGTGYTVEFSSDWKNMVESKDQIGKNSAAIAEDQFGIDSSSFTGMDSVCAYKPDGVSQSPVFNVVSPITNSLFRSVKIKDLEQALTLSIKQQLANQEGFKLESKGIVSYNGFDFLELNSEYAINGTKTFARQFFALNGDKEYIISFSNPGGSDSDFWDETEKVMKTFRFTEGE